MEVMERLPLLGYSRREDPRDVLVLPKGVTRWDQTKPVGTSSLRRIMQLHKLFPDVQTLPVRGNVPTRLQKLDAGEYGALILAASGLKRLHLEDRIARCFEPEELLPAAGQGTLAVQGRAGEDYSFLDGFFDADSRDTSLCERAFVAALDGGCTAPTAAFAEILPDGERIQLTGLYFDEEVGVVIRRQATGLRTDAVRLGTQLASAVKRR